jgi:recombination protein RecA
MLARADLESLLRVKKLDRTLIPARQHRESIPTGLSTLDTTLGGGLPRGELSEIVGPRSSGRTTVAFGAMRSAGEKGELAALVDTFDRFDPESAAAAGIRLAGLLWVRGEPTGGQGPSGRARLDPGPALERAVKAFNLVLQAGGFAVAALDLADVAPSALRRLPFTTWFRLARAVEGRRTAALIVAPDHLARSPGGVTVVLEAAPRWVGSSDRARICEGLWVHPSVSSLPVS